MTKRLRQIPSDRELYRRLWNDPTLRMICDIEERARATHTHEAPHTLVKIKIERERFEQGLKGENSFMGYRVFREL